VGGVGFHYFLDRAVLDIFGEKATLSSILLRTGGKVLPYGFAVYAWGHTLYSIFSKDPVSRARQRGYTLK